VTSPRRWLFAAVAILLLALTFTGGIWVDQTFPEDVPLLQLGSGNRKALDQPATDEALRVIEAHYYNRNLDYPKLSHGSIRGLVQALGDPYTEYLDSDQVKSQQDFYAGRHAGMIGIYVNYRDNYPVISGVLPNSPALKAGLQTDDVILKINGTDARGLQSEQTSALIRGPAGSKLTLHLRRGTQELDAVVTREDFQSPSVESARLDGDILYVRVYDFGDSTQRDFDAQLASGLPGARGVVLDLRDNGGGFVSAATAVISRFVTSGEAFEEKGRDGNANKTAVTGGHPAANVPLTVLVNGNSASASEIVAGSLQAHHRAELVGVKTFGKGSVQVDYHLSDGGDLHLTVEHWFLPNGRSVDGGVGLTPDVKIDLPDKAAMFDVVQPARGHAGDVQLNRALQLLGSP
jgi:carboxyl-terminal processing protease